MHGVRGKHRCNWVMGGSDQDDRNLHNGEDLQGGWVHAKAFALPWAFGVGSLGGTMSPPDMCTLLSPWRGEGDGV